VATTPFTSLLRLPAKQTWSHPPTPNCSQRHNATRSTFPTLANPATRECLLFGIHPMQPQTVARTVITDW